MKKTLSLLAFTIICGYASAQVYSYVDANGKTIYTDNPPKGQKVKVMDLETKVPINKLEQNGSAQKTVRLSPQGQPTTNTSVNSYTNSSNNNSSLNVTRTPVTISYKLLRIALPEPDTSIINTGGQMMVSLESEPKLLKNHRYRVLIDDKVVAESSSTPVFSLDNLERGEHKLVAEIVDQDDRIIERTAAQPFHIKQTTLADKRRIKPCKYKDYGLRPECPLKDKPPKESLLREITNKLGVTTTCDLPDYGVKEGCPIEEKPEKPENKK